MAKQNETAGIFIQTKTALLPFLGLQVMNLGRDGELFHSALTHDGKEVKRVSGASEAAAMKLASQIIADIAKRIADSEKTSRLVIEL